jgi:hypothetical protein
MINCNVFKLALFYDWTPKNKLKLLSTGGFYYRLKATIYDILYEDNYFDEDD